MLAQQLAPILGVDATTLAHRLSDRTHTYVDLVRGVSTTTVARLKRHHIGQGVLGFIPGDRRVYPQGDIGAQVLGLTGTNGQGLAGAELSLDHMLRATEGQQVVVRDLDGRLLRVVSDHPGVPGHDVQLTLDRDIQATVEQTVAATQARWHARWATAVVMDPRTGGILGMASAPGLPAGGYAKGTFGQQRMRTLADQYEPGSTFKAVTIGAALAEGAVTPTTRFIVPDAIKRYDKTVHDAHAHRRRGGPSPTSWPSRRTSARSRSPSSGSGPSGSTAGRIASASGADGRRPAGRGSRRGPAARPVVGHDDPQHPDRRGRAGDAAADGLALRRRSPTAASGTSRTWSTGSWAARRRTSTPAACSRRAWTARSWGCSAAWSRWAPARRRASRATPWPARRARRRRSIRRPASTTARRGRCASTTARSSASCPRTTRGRGPGRGRRAARRLLRRRRRRAGVPRGRHRARCRRSASRRTTNRPRAGRLTSRR